MIQTVDLKLIAMKYVKQGSFVRELLDHLEGTARLAQELAERNGLSPEMGFATGYWHDVSRSWDDEQSRGFVAEHELDLDLDTEVLTAGTSLIHGHVAAHLWQEEFAPQVKWQNAIACHTLGTANPTLYDQIIGVADFAAYDRRKPIAEQIRKIALADLFKAYLLVYESKVKHLVSQGKKVHPQAQNTLLALQRSANAG